MSIAKSGDLVAVNYVGSFADGSIFDSTEGMAPFEFTLGTGETIPGFEDGVLGMQVGEVKKLTIPAAEAYGEYMDDLVVPVPKTDFPADLEPEVGMELTAGDPNGEEMLLTVLEILDDVVIVDANHPLAGEDLTFEITLVELK
jgi:peptidylprolyl isomerase